MSVFGLQQLSKPEQSHCKVYVSLTSNWRMHWLIRYWQAILHSGCQQALLANSCERRVPSHNVFRAPRGVIIIQRMTFGLTPVYALWRYCHFPFDGRISPTSYRNLTHPANRPCFVITANIGVFRTTVTSLGHLMKPEWLGIESRAVKSLKEAFIRSDKRKVRSSLGWAIFIVASFITLSVSSIRLLRYHKCEPRRFSWPHIKTTNCVPNTHKILEHCMESETFEITSALLYQNGCSRLPERMCSSPKI